MFKSSLTVTGFSLLTQALGFLKLLLVAQYFGVGAALDGYYLSLVIPTLLLGFVVGALQTGFMPVYGELLAEKKVEEALLFRSHLLWIILLSLACVCLMLSFFSKDIMQLIVSNDSPEVNSFAVYSFQLIVFILALNALADYLALILNVHGKFWVAASAPLFNVIVSTAYLFLTHESGLDALIFGLLLGVLIQVAAVLYILYKSRLHFLFSLPTSSLELKKAWRLALPILIGVALVNANFSIDQMMASTAGEGAVSILGYASRFHNIISQAGIIGISTVLLPTLIMLIANKQELKAFELLGRLFFIVLIVSIIILGAVFFAGERALNMLIVRGSFTAEDASQVFNVWLYYTLGLFPMACGIFYAKLYQALQLPMVITRLAIISFSLNVVLNWVLVREFGVAGIAMATSLVYLLVTILFYIFTRKRWANV